MDGLKGSVQVTEDQLTAFSFQTKLSPSIHSVNQTPDSTSLYQFPWKDYFEYKHVEKKICADKLGVGSGTARKIREPHQSKPVSSGPLRPASPPLRTAEELIAPVGEMN